MPLNTEQIIKVENVITDSIRSKLQSYRPETSNMPFH
jgi:hypothetical protein